MFFYPTALAEPGFHQFGKHRFLKSAESRFPKTAETDFSDFCRNKITIYSGRALSPQATILDNFCFSLHNMQFLEERPAELRQEIFDLLFETAEIATFTPEDKVKYEFDMTTERDIRNQIRFAEKQAASKAAEQTRKETQMEASIKTARLMLADHKPMDEIVKYSGLTEEQVRAL